MFLEEMIVFSTYFTLPRTYQTRTFKDFVTTLEEVYRRTCVVVYKMNMN